MSVRLMGSVFYLNLRPVEKLVLLALADHANDDGGQCFPSVGRIALKTSLSRRGVQKVYRRLEAKGILVPIGQRWEGMTEYRIVVERGERSSLGQANLSAPQGERASHESSLTVKKLTWSKSQRRCKEEEARPYLEPMPPIPCTQRR